MLHGGYPHGEVHTVEQVIETTGRRFSKKPRLTFKTAWVKSTSSGTGPGIEGVYTPQRRKDNVADEGEMSRMEAVCPFPYEKIFLGI